VKVTVALVSPRTTSVIVGALGGPTGITDPELVDGVDEPAALLATTVNVKVAPLERPETVHPVALAATVHEAPPGDAVTV
jgi:hypothetical protein